VIWW